ncbi:hypothetical protein [Pseudonocardia sp. 73-21]|uniref:hypothetical protein n=1 Tax=Pseudonocardia sp. 73-21 TaxID=1895809 RepID=UPI002602A68B|nr:hypothetical protein [Pseudonocardia sp. 73-21]
MSPMTMYRSVDGKRDEYHLMYLGARAAGGFGLITSSRSPRPRGPHHAALRRDLGHLVLLGHPALSNPHRPVWAARELGHKDPFELVPEDWGWWLQELPRPRPEHRLARGPRHGRGGGRRDRSLTPPRAHGDPDSRSPTPRLAHAHAPTRGRLSASRGLRVAESGSPCVSAGRGGGSSRRPRAGCPP